ncbi:hypothetical protein CYMTET_35572, partial [Cymbomonas tetramitiformis]
MEFVAQEDLIEPSLTTLEVIYMFAVIKLPLSMRLRDKRQKAKEMIRNLGLESVANMYVGGNAMQGSKKTLSGGEMRRLSIGCCIVSDPKLVLLDEPTTGLDSANAMEVVEVLLSLRLGGCSLVCSIHQPRYEIFQKFDYVLLLAAGHLVASGALSDLSRFYVSLFPERPFKDQFLADYFLDHLAHLDSVSARELRDTHVLHTKSNSSGRKQSIVKARRTLSLTRGESLVAKKEKPGLWITLPLFVKLKLKVRLIREGNLRNACVFPFIWLLLTGTAWANQNGSDSDMYGALLVIIFVFMFRGLATYVSVIPRRKQYVHDNDLGLYGPIELFVGEQLAEWSEILCYAFFFWIPWSFLAGLRTSPEHLFYGLFACYGLAGTSNAMALILLFVIDNVTLLETTYAGSVACLMAYSGVYCDTDDLVPAVFWIPKVNPFYYAVSAFMQNQFENTDYGESDDMAAYFEYSKSTCMVLLWVFAFLYNLTAFLLLKTRAWQTDWSQVLANVNKALMGSGSEAATKTPFVPLSTDSYTTFASPGTPVMTPREVVAVKGPPLHWSNVYYTVELNPEATNDEEMDPEEGLQDGEEDGSGGISVGTELTTKKQEIADATDDPLLSKESAVPLEVSSTELKDPSEPLEAAEPSTGAAGGKTHKPVLIDCSGILPGSSMCALMGPSGAGKTSLLHLLGGKELPGETTGKLPDLNWEETGFVWQEDNLEPTCTVRETLRFYADLKLPSAVSEEYRAECVDSVIHELNLGVCSESVVGGTSVLTSSKTLSGGQRRRVSIACAL